MRGCVLLLVLATVSTRGQQGPVPEIRYRGVADFLKLPSDLYLGEVKSWGEPGGGPGQFNTPHSIAVDAQGCGVVELACAEIDP